MASYTISKIHKEISDQYLIETIQDAYNLAVLNMDTLT